MWLVLAIISGFLNFIPNLGPLIAMVPPVLVGLMLSPATAAIVAVIYTLIQVIESNFITPPVQQKLISIPPALIIIAQLLISPPTGSWGLVFASFNGYYNDPGAGIIYKKAGITARMSS